LTFGQALHSLKSGMTLTRTYVESDAVVVVFCKYRDDNRLIRKKVTSKHKSDWRLSGWSLKDMSATDWIVAG
jgi:hypothetical protein